MLIGSPSGAYLSPCRTYRYALWRQWDPTLKFVVFIGVNPSTADELVNDNTINRCIAFAKAWGYGGLVMVNLFAYRHRDPKVMKAAADPIGPENDRILIELAKDAGVVVAAWGVNGVHLQRDVAVRRMLSNLHYLRLTKNGMPEHPLYLPKILVPQLWTQPEEALA